MYQDYITHNQAELTERYGFAIPLNDTSYQYLHVSHSHPPAPVIRGADNPTLHVHEHNICEASTDVLAYVLTQLIRNNTKYMQAGKQLLNCLSGRINEMVRQNGGNAAHLVPFGVLMTLQEIIGRAGVQSIYNIEVTLANPQAQYHQQQNPNNRLTITLRTNPGFPRRFHRVVAPGNGAAAGVGVGVPPRALQAFAQGAPARHMQILSFSIGPPANPVIPFAPGQYINRQINLQGGRRKTRHTKKSKKSKTRKH
jgi:hypothetical protein